MPSQQHPNNPGTFHLLVVDDDENDFLLLDRAVRKSGFPWQMHLAKNGEDALVQLNTVFLQDLPAAVLSDLKMPRMNGLELLEKVRSQVSTAFLPFIFFTSSSHHVDRGKADELKATAYFVKPSKAGGYSELLPQINEFIAYQ